MNTGGPQFSDDRCKERTREAGRSAFTSKRAYLKTTQNQVVYPFKGHHLQKCKNASQWPSITKRNKNPRCENAEIEMWNSELAAPDVSLRRTGIAPLIHVVGEFVSLNFQAHCVGLDRA